MGVRLNGEKQPANRNETPLALKVLRQIESGNEPPERATSNRDERQNHGTSVGTGSRKAGGRGKMSCNKNVRLRPAMPTPLPCQK